MRKILSVAILALFLFCGFSTRAEEDMISLQSVRITAEDNGKYTLRFNGDLDPNERFAWFVCTDQDEAEYLMGLMRNLVADGTPVYELEFDYLFSEWPTHGIESFRPATVPEGSQYVFYGKAYCKNPSHDPVEGIYMSTLGGTDLSKLKPGDVGGNDLEDGDRILPRTGDSSKPFLFAVLLVASALGLAMLIKQSVKTRAAR